MLSDMRLIDADALRKLLADNFFQKTWDGCQSEEYYIAADTIRDAATIDAVPVVHGRWEEADDGDGAVCSVCGEDFCNVYLEVERFNYCPNCGAKMDGKSNVPRES